MASDRLNGILRHLLGTVRPLEEQDTDARLLEHYLRQRDESAFELLVQRHGPMVLGVCRRILANEQDAEDAFQATFLVLLRKAASVRNQASLASWLYRVAYRTAQEARRAMVKRRIREARVVPRQEAPPRDDGLREVLDRELAGLPERYRAAVVLCDLEGKERKEAALALGCPEGTVASRLARGRSLLAKRLARHGLTVAALAAIQQSSTCVTAALVSSTLRAARSTGPGAAGAISINVSFLVERVVRSMLVVKLRAMTAVVLLVGAVGSAAGWLYYHREAAAQPDVLRGIETPLDQRQQAKMGKDFAELLEEEEKMRPPLLKTKVIEVNKEDDELHRLLKERYNEALMELTLYWQAFYVGRGTLDQVCSAGTRLVKAGLEVKGKPEEQVALLRQYVEVTKEVEKILRKRFKEGRISLVLVHQARYFRLDAEIELLRLQKKGK